MAKANIYNMVNGLKSYIQADLPAQLRLIEAEIGGGLTLPDPVDYVLGYRDPFNAREYPLVEVVGTDIMAEPGGITAATWRQPEVDVILAFKHSDPEKLEMWLLLYADAMFNLLDTDAGFHAICDTSQTVTGKLFHGAPGDQSVAIFMITVGMNKEFQA